MEFILLPAHRGNPPLSTPRTPYVCQERYDGGPWLSYPERVGKSISAWNGSSFDYTEYHRSSKANPTPIPELESFLQTWLYFGLIAEFAGINASSEDNIEQGSSDFIERMYKTMLYQEGDKIYVNLDSEFLDSLLVVAISNMPRDPDELKQRYEHLVLCLTYAQPVFSTSPATINHSVKYSIGALGEILNETTNLGLERLGIPRTFSRQWSIGFLDQGATSTMLKHGWCPSDIARAQAKYTSIQLLNVARMLDKSLPYRDHSNCTNISCGLYQIDMGKYEVGHQFEGCVCKQISVKSVDLERILKKDGLFPVLCLKGDIDSLEVELQEWRPGMSYTAISHVWADGLGNPFSNSLHRCKLLELRNRVAAMSRAKSIIDDEQRNSLIWLDTLCCPAEEGEGKNAGIEKIRLVYREASSVLVLDSGLMAFDAKPQDISEQLARIFTSSWMRRLWTLQEGALAQSLFFQFSDTALSLNQLGASILQIRQQSIRHRSVFLDVVKEFLGLKSFMSENLTSLQTLDESLKWRGVSVATDEPLCIATLMSLKISDILATKPKDARMQKVWELIQARDGGIPSQIIFFEEERIKAPGWKWAPQSLLQLQMGIHGLINTRLLRWASTLAKITPYGLRVKYPGYKLSTVSTYGDSRPKNPWLGFERIPESYIHFRDRDTGDWFRIIDKVHAFVNDNFTSDDERWAFNDLKLFPLHRLADSQKAVLVISEDRTVKEAVLASLAEKEVDGLESAILVHTERIVMVQPLPPDEAYIHETIRGLAHKLRKHPLTDTHLKIHAENLGGDSDKLEESVKSLKEKMKDSVRDVAAYDSRFVIALNSFFGQGFEGKVWVLIYDFFNGDYLGERISGDQDWLID